MPLARKKKHRCVWNDYCVSSDIRSFPTLNSAQSCWSEPMSLTLSEINDERDVFVQTFDEETRLSLMHEDAAAWRAVCGVLITVVGVGLLIGIFAVLLA